MPIKDYLDKSKIFDREIDRLTYARDASIYRILPEFAVRPKNEDDIKHLFKFATAENKSITFRASGTSLSGQTVTNGIVAEIAYDWQKIEVKNNGTYILLEPGVIAAHANQSLLKYQRRIGPDPASIKAARIGGIIANNASGMTTGKPCNSYNTLKNIRFILPNGNIYDTSNSDDYNKFLIKELKLSTGIQNIQKSIISNNALKKKIINKYRLKNTIGYSMNSFIDYQHPLDIFAHLLIGSEGTLAFVSNVELATVFDPPYKSTGLILFSNIKDACNAIEDIKKTGVHGLELMDYACLKTAKYFQDAPYDVNSLKDGSAALLGEFQEFYSTKFDSLEKELLKVINRHNGKLVGDFAHDENDRLKLWKIRKSLFTTVGSLRKPGTSIITEDICFDIKYLGEVITELHGFFEKWNYKDAVIFGHAKDGNLHFNLSLDLNSEEGVNNYHKMMNEIAHMTIDKYNGSLKAEHGTGRNMAPFVEYEWGSRIYNMMWEVKNLADPFKILNNGVILNSDKNIHTKNLKSMPIVNNKIDLCVECGFCEHVCPSRRFTFTPRNRIAVAREMSLTENRSRRLEKDFYFNSELTCAVDGMCEIECPININTGEYVKELRTRKHSIIGSVISNWIANNFMIVAVFLRIAIKMMSNISISIGHNFVENVSVNINKIFYHVIPSWNSNITGINKISKTINVLNKIEYIYYPSCISRSIGSDSEGESLINIIVEIANECNIKLKIPDKISDTCCGTPFSSKGYRKAELSIFERTVDILYSESNYGKYPIIVDTSPCTYKFLNPDKSISKTTLEKWRSLRFIDIVVFLNMLVEKEANDRQPLDREILVHPTCSTHKMSDTVELEILAKRCAKNVTIPQNSSCCGFAGDRGLLIPDLTKNAVDLNRTKIGNIKIEGYSSSRMCEIGMSNTDQNYRNIAYLVRDFVKTK